MEFCSIQSADEDIVAELMHVYPDTIEDLYQKDYAGRYATEEDARVAQAVEYADFIAVFISQEDRYIFTLRDGNTIVAALRVIHMGGDNWYLEALGTAPEYRGQGCARRLLKETLRLMRVLSARSIVSLVRWDNIASRTVHEACGFADTGKTARDTEGAVVEECLVYRYIYPNRA